MSQFSEIAGGPCKYKSGSTVKSAERFLSAVYPPGDPN
jgi:hypothetical protein